MARFPTSSPAPTLFALAGGLILVSAIAARILIPPTIHMRISQDELRLMEQAVERNRNARGPQLESAKFTTGDALAGIGANWTFLEQSVLTGAEPARIPGTVPSRQSRLKHGDNVLQLVIHEAKKGNASVLEKALSGYEKIGLAGREGYLVPDASGGASVLFVGSSSVLLLTGVPSVDWKKSLPEALTAYIATVNIP